MATPLSARALQKWSFCRRAQTGRRVEWYLDSGWGGGGCMWVPLQWHKQLRGRWGENGVGWRLREVDWRPREVGWRRCRSGWSAEEWRRGDCLCLLSCTCEGARCEV